MGERAAGVDGRAPRVPLDEELGELTMREDPIVARRWSEPRQPREARKDVRGIERTPKRALDLLAQSDGSRPPISMAEE